MRNCLNCGGPMKGLRRDALYCRTACRVAACKARRDARLRHEAMRELAQKIDPTGEILGALDDLEAAVPNFAVLNDHAMDAGRHAQRSAVAGSG